MINFTEKVLRNPIFINPEPIEIINNSLHFCFANRQLRIHAYVTMPNHIHLIISDENYDNERLGKTLVDFRKFTGHKLADYIDANVSESFAIQFQNISEPIESIKFGNPVVMLKRCQRRSF